METRKLLAGFADFTRSDRVMCATLSGLAKRRLVGVVEARLAEGPVVVRNGPRTVGKSTLLSQLGEQLGRSVIDC
jgi:uncharacterized protein